MGQIRICSTSGVEVTGVPEEIKILPKGLVQSQKGKFLVDDESFGMIQKRFKDRNIDIVIDYEHQTLENVQAPAGGWIKELINTPDAIVAKVEWTEKAAEYLKNKEYRYLSPVIKVRPSDNKAFCLHSVALTNTPAIDGMFAIANSEDIDIEDDNVSDKEGGKNKMELQVLIKLLGLDEKATEEQVKEALEKLVTTKTEEGQPKKQEGEEKDGEGQVIANSTILTLLGLQDSAKTEDVAAKIISLKNGGDGIATQFLAMKQQMEEKEASESVELALKEGKISASQSEWAKNYALKDPDGFKKFMEKAPKAVPMGRMDFVAAPKSKLKDEDVDVLVLKNLGFNEEEIHKMTKEDK